MIIKKKDDKDIEVADGFKGLILPFDLVQKNILNENLIEIERLNSKLSSITASFDEILETIDEEDKGEFINEDGTGFVPKEISKMVKSYKKQVIEEASLESKIIAVNNLIEDEKKLKKEIKCKTEILHQLTIETIENLSTEEGLKLLNIKWNNPIVESINKLPGLIIDELVTKVNALKKKYSDTLLDVETEIENTSRELNSLIDELVGDEFDMRGLLDLKKLLGGE